MTGEVQYGHFKTIVQQAKPFVSKQENQKTQTVSKNKSD